MSKGLEALEKIKNVDTNYDTLYGAYTNEINTIEKELKAFDVIKSKLTKEDISIDYQKIETKQGDKVLVCISRKDSIKFVFIALAQEEFELLKEVLCDE